MRAHALAAVSAYGQRGCAAPQGRTGRVVPVSQLAKFARVARGFLIRIDDDIS